MFPLKLIQRRLTFFILIGITILLIASFNIVNHHPYMKSPEIHSTNALSCNVSMIESDQFFCESNEKWQERRQFYSNQRDKNVLAMNEYKNYFRKNWFPEFKCEDEI